MVLFDLTMQDAEAELAGLNRRLEALGTHHGWPMRAQGALQIGLDEWISNIIEHGYSATGGRGPVRVVVGACGDLTGTGTVAEAGAIFARVEDWGPGFDPTRAVVREGAKGGDLNPGLTPGMGQGLGQGLRLLRHLCSGLRYRSDHGCNRLSLRVPA